MATFGEKLKAEREKKGLTQVALAEATGINRVMIARLEGGAVVSPTWATVQKLAAALEISCEVFQDAPPVKSKRR